MRERSLDELSFSLFAGLLHTTFRVDVAPGRAVELELTQASLAPAPNCLTAGSSPRAADYERFSLLFRGARSEPLGQKTHRFEHSQIGRFDMFIVPMRSSEPKHACYEAVFSRPRPMSPAAG